MKRACVPLVLCGLLAMAAPADAQDPPQVRNVAQVNLNFQPSDQPVQVGDTVVWTWNNFGDHTVTEGTGTPLSFDELLTPGNPTVTIVFDEAAFDLLTRDPGNVVDYYCIPHLGFGMTGTLTFSPWIDHGPGLAGTTTPTLTGSGPMTDGSTTNELVFDDMLPDSTVFIVVGITALDAPFKGGILGPDLLLDPIALPTGPTGSITIPFTWPGGAPIGTDLYLQGWIQDPGGPVGFSSTRTIRAAIPGL